MGIAHTHMHNSFTSFHLTQWVPFLTGSCRHCPSAHPTIWFCKANEMVEESLKDSVHKLMWWAWVILILTMMNSFIIYLSTIFSPSLYPLSSSSPFLPACISISTLTGQRTTAQSMQLLSLVSSEYSRRHSSSWEEDPLSYMTGLLSICLSMYPTLSVHTSPSQGYVD